MIGRNPAGIEVLQVSHTRIILPVSGTIPGFQKIILKKGKNIFVFYSYFFAPAWGFSYIYTSRCNN